MRATWTVPHATRALAALTGAAAAFLFHAADPGSALANQTTDQPAGPHFLFVLADNVEGLTNVFAADGVTITGTTADDGMDEEWLGVGTPRADVVKQAIRHVVMNAPPEVKFGAVRAFNEPSGSGLTSNIQIAAVDDDRPSFLEALDAWTVGSGEPDTDDLPWAETYSRLIEDYFSLTGVTDGVHSGWSRSPFDTQCSEVHVIVIGRDVGDDDTDYFAPYALPYVGDYTTGPGDSDGKLDNIANYAHNTDLSSLTNYVGLGQVTTTHVVVVDGTLATADTKGLMAAAASAGGGLYFEANQEQEVALSIWKVITDAYDGIITRSGPVVSNNVDYLFQGYSEITAQFPLQRGHMLYYELEDDPDSANYGQIIPSGGSDDWLWDAGEILASRYALHAEYNTGYEFIGVVNYSAPRTIFTNEEQSGFPYDTAPADLVALDITGTASVDADGNGDYTDPGDTLGDLVELLVPLDPYSVADCDAMDYDMDVDCDVDPDDAQLLIDFIRGVNPTQDPSYPEAGAFAKDTSLRRDTWKLGGIGRSRVAYAPAEPRMLTSKADFYNFLTRIGNMASMLYVTSNDGMLHAFNVPEQPTHSGQDPNGGWEFWGFIPRHLLAHDNAGFWQPEEMRAVEQKFSGQTTLNDGTVAMEYVWIDNVCNYLIDPEDPGNPDNCGDTAADNAPAEDGSEWHRVLVVTMGQASRHAYALDVCDPREPLFMWDVPDADAADAAASYGADPGGYMHWGRGTTMSRPAVGVVYDNDVPSQPQRFVAFWGSGIPFDSVKADGPKYYVHPNLYMVDLLDPFGTSATDTDDEGVLDERGFEAPAPTALLADPDPDSDPNREYDPDSGAALFGSPAAVDIDADGGIDVVYIGDRSGYLYKYVMNNDDLNDPDSCIFAEPYDAGGWTEDDTRNLYYRPTVTFDLDGTLRILFGTGSPLSLNNYRSPGYFLFYEDQDPFGCSMGAPSDCTGNGSIVDGRLDLDVGEKLVGSPVVAAGVVYFTTYVGDSNPCEIGDGKLYGLAIADCSGALYDYDGDSYTVDSNTSITIPGIPSEVTFANDSIYVSSTSPGAEPAPLDPIRVAPTGNQMSRVVFSNWRNIF